jgi:hypothetical protein
MGKKNFLIREQQANDIEALQKMLNDPNITAETKQGIQGLIANAQKFAQQQQPPAAPTTAPITPASPSATQQTPAASASEPQVQRAKNPYSTDYQGNSIVDFLKQSGQASDMASRKALAQRMGIQNYSGTAEQNTQMLNSLKQQAQKFSTQDKESQKQKMEDEQYVQNPPSEGQKPLNVGNVSIGNPTQQPSTSPTTQTPKPKVDVKIPKNMQFNPNKPEEGEENEEGSKKFQYFGLNKTTVQEKNNISKFLRHVSEKNYSSAHKYLKAIVESKIKRNILQRIGKI